ncbi:hypothetical protein OG897_35505 [Streptomyces sp. NBC_00237]|uniref:hypothetical protein n=1 Tax=Streptomyces sp. NBC_00237 TaxID=2975687 RepID=UPI002251CB4C|nr:hypothetical protein [Streptomyces sp. NBC_00237]MCX5206698.1 hypothetical protein [Streptomyces sp. NBC_00237]
MTDPRTALIAALHDELPGLSWGHCVHLADAVAARLAGDGITLVAIAEQPPP